MTSPSQVVKCGSKSELVSWKWNGGTASAVEAKANTHAATETRVTSQRNLTVPPCWDPRAATLAAASTFGNQGYLVSVRVGESVDPGARARRRTRLGDRYRRSDVGGVQEQEGGAHAATDAAPQPENGTQQGRG